MPKFLVDHSVDRLNQDTQSVWDFEYRERRALPSTLAIEPSRCLSRVNDIFPHFEGLRILDIGCGNGRHSKFFASQGAIVHAVDISSVAIEICRENLKFSGFGERVSIHHGSCLDFIPVIDEGFDIVLDSYMSCHLTTSQERRQLFQKVHEVLAPKGTFLSFGISPFDNFYAQFSHAQIPDGEVVIDSLSRIPKLITSENYLRREFTGLFEVFRAENLFMTDQMGTQQYNKAAVLIAACLPSRK